LPLSHLRGLKGCQKVAAVCYRLRNGSIEFLLVRTRNRRWTFPKGGVEPGLTHAQAAALEAFEEAGVHGRMEEAAFARYLRSRGNSRHVAGRSTAKELSVNAHLCEVVRLDPPQETNRNPTWFSAPQAKRRLRDGRNQDYGAELARVVDSAVVRIQRSNIGTGTRPAGPHTDALHKVQFEAGEAAAVYGRIKEASLHVRRQPDGLGHSAIEVAVNAYLCEVLRLGRSQASDHNSPRFPTEKARRLLMEHGGTGEAADDRQEGGPPQAQVTEIDHSRGTTIRADAPVTRALRPARRSLD
jgi:8-oxo-dGTP pyrophosphatase MutT (NUDIX family)